MRDLAGFDPALVVERQQRGHVLNVGFRSGHLRCALLNGIAVFFLRGAQVAEVFRQSTLRLDGGDVVEDGAPDADPLWLMLDWTPEGRGTDWYPRLNYEQE